MMRRCLSLFLIVGLIAVLAVPVSAQESNDTAWIELMEEVSIGDDGKNWWYIENGQGVLTIPMYAERRLRKIDLLLWTPSGNRPTSASVTKGSKTTNLEIYSVGSYLTRICGYLPDSWYEEIEITLTKSNTTRVAYEVLSCKVTPLSMQEFEAAGSVLMDGKTYSFGTHIDIAAGVSGGTTSTTIRIDITDWQKFDKITVWGSSEDLLFTSFRATLGTQALTYDISYMSDAVTGQWTQSAHEFNGTFYTDENGEYYGDEYGGAYWDYGEGEISGDGFSEGYVETVTDGKRLFYLEFDLSGVDRSSVEPIYVYVTGLYHPYNGCSFNCQYVSGSVYIADTTDVAADARWWSRFSSFMIDLFGSDDSGALDDLGSNSDSISQSVGQIQEFEESQQAVLDNNLTQIQTTVDFTNFAAALSFVQSYINMTVIGISDYVIVFTLPMFLGLFFFLCSRVPGITRWKSPPPRSKQKGGGAP